MSEFCDSPSKEIRDASKPQKRVHFAPETMFRRPGTRKKMDKNSPRKSARGIITITPQSKIITVGSSDLGNVEAVRRCARHIRQTFHSLSTLGPWSDKQITPSITRETCNVQINSLSFFLENNLLVFPRNSPAFDFLDNCSKRESSEWTFVLASDLLQTCSLSLNLHKKSVLGTHVSFLKTPLKESERFFLEIIPWGFRLLSKADAQFPGPKSSIFQFSCHPKMSHEFEWLQELHGRDTPFSVFFWILYVRAQREKVGRKEKHTEIWDLISNLPSFLGMSKFFWIHRTDASV